MATVNIEELVYEVIKDIQKRFGFKSESEVIEFLLQYYLDAIPKKVNRPLALIQYIGGDTRLVKYMLNWIPKHKVYVEVFGGGGIFLLNKPPSTIEIYNDINKNLTTLFEVVRKNYLLFAERLEFLPINKEVFKELRKKVLTRRGFADPVDQAVAFFYVILLSVNASPRGGFSEKKFRFKVIKNKLKILKFIWERLRTVCITNLDFRKAIKKFDSEETFFYMDPPYPDIEEHYTGDFRENDLLALLTLLDKENKRFQLKGKFLLKYDARSPTVRDWAKKNGYVIKEIEIQKSSAYWEDRSKARIKYMFIMNYEPESNKNEGLLRYFVLK